ncbi:MAG TPA: choice-of-anchor D domain-containing protein, partial [Candidatus Kapabacteria bacterium]
MKKILLLVFFSLFFITGTSWSQTPVVVKDSIAGNVTWTADKTYLIQGFLYVVDGATLTIQPGTLIMGDKASKGTLIIERGGKIIAQGTATRPIVFTSQLDPGNRQNGDWGGIIICGKAPINPNNTLNGGSFPGGEAQIEGGPRSKYGGSDPFDYSGVLSYVRIEFSGIALAPNNETNSLTMGGVGSYTQIDHVQCSYGGDDGFEWFGGTVNAKYLVGFKSLDDDWDTDFGWSGKAQFAVSLRDPNIADVSGSNGFESDNNATGQFVEPRTKPILSNFTVIGPQPDTSAAFNSLYKNGTHIRRSSQENIFNSIVMGWPGALLMDGTGVTNGATNDTVQLRNNIYAGLRAGKDFTTNTGNPFNTYQWFATTAYQNRGYTQPAEVMLQDPFNQTAPNWSPKSGSPAISGASFANPKLTDPFFTTTSYVGAFDPSGTRWDAGWAEYNPVTADYSARPQGLVTEVNFGTITVGTSKDSAVVVIRNAGFGSLSVTAANITGAQFSLQGLTVPFTLLGGESKTVTIRYTPNDTASHSGSIQFVTSNGNTTLSLKGKGKISAPGMSTDYNALDYALVPVGQSVTYNVVITNTGNATLNLSNFRITGIDAGSFSIIAGGADGTLAPAAKRTVSIRFAPPAIGDRTASFLFDHNAAGSPKSISLKGKGIAVPNADVLQDSISGNITLTNDRIWLLRGFVYVVNGATLN